MSFECNFCGGMFSSKYNLGTHQETAKYCLTARELTSTGCACENCGKEFSTKSNLKYHSQKCAGRTPAKIQAQLISKAAEINEENKKLKEKIKNLKIEISKLKIENANLELKNAKLLPFLQLFDILCKYK